MHTATTWQSNRCGCNFIRNNKNLFFFFFSFILYSSSHSLSLACLLALYLSDVRGEALFDCIHFQWASDNSVSNKIKYTKNNEERCEKCEEQQSYIAVQIVAIKLLLFPPLPLSLSHRRQRSKEKIFIEWSCVVLC